MVKRDVFSDVITFNILMDALCKVDMTTEAYGLLEVMIERGQKPDSFSYSISTDGYA